GQAVTCEDFYAAMCDANNAHLPNFLQWYSQAGTPTVKVTSSYDEGSQAFSLKLRSRSATYPWPTDERANVHTCCCWTC
uniref:Uncharacterized protein n=1 Tax=Aegilops tauschii subsp. strangulata TaxID=200361 RepID=A0A453KI31_AEGTS